MYASRLIIILMWAGLACQPQGQKGSQATAPPEADSTAILNKRPGPDAPRSAADRLVRALYFEHNKTENPFRERKDRQLIDQFFADSTADLLWNGGKAPAIPLSNLLFKAPDGAIHKTWVEPAAVAGTRAVVYVTFQNKARPEEIKIELRQKAGRWRIVEMYYPDSTQLTHLLRG